MSLTSKSLRREALFFTAMFREVAREVICTRDFATHAAVGLPAYATAHVGIFGAESFSPSVLIPSALTYVLGWAMVEQFLPRRSPKLLRVRGNLRRLLAELKAGD